MERNQPTPVDTASNQQPTPTGNVRKPYTAPAITHELLLETRAGSPIGLFEPFDPRPRIS